MTARKIIKKSTREKPAKPVNPSQKLTKNAIQSSGKKSGPKNSLSLIKADKAFFRDLRSKKSIGYVAQTRTEEIFNTLTHGLGTVLSVIGVVVLLAFSAQSGDALRMMTTGIYGFSLIFMYVASMLYHGTSEIKLKKFFHLLDHSAIFVLIAGANTPIMLVYLKDHWGWWLFGATWALAALGVFLELYYYSRLPKKVSLILYSAMGCMVMIAAKPTFELVPSGLLTYIFLGGALFFSGIYFYVKKTLFFNHVIWHLIVFAGTVFHYIGMLKYVAMECD